MVRRMVFALTVGAVLAVCGSCGDENKPAPSTPASQPGGNVSYKCGCGATKTVAASDSAPSC